MGLADEILAANERYAAVFPGAPEAAPARRLVVVTCMDVRIDPLALAGLQAGDAHVLRNAGAVVTDDVLRSLFVSSSLLGTVAAIVVGHTECGLPRLLDPEVRARVEAETGLDLDSLDLRPFADVAAGVRAGVLRIRESPLLPDGYEAAGFVYDVATGRLEPVEPG